MIFVLQSCNKVESKRLENSKTNEMTHPAKNISISINKSSEEVYQFASNPENFPKWLAFVKTISEKSGSVWAAETDLGKIEIELTPANKFGIIDHVVTLPGGAKVKNPLRVIENGEGSEVVFTLFRMPTKTEKEFNDDADLVKADLKMLKDILENQ